MGGLRLWLRHCTAAKAAPALVGWGVVGVASRHGWEHDWRWAMDWASFSLYVTGPALAGVVAFDRSRRVEPTLAAMGRSASRRPQADVALVVASWGWALLAWVPVLVFVGVRVHQAEGVASPDPWSFVLPPAMLLACGAFGLLVGSVLPTLAAGPVAAVAAYLMPVGNLLSSVKLPTLLGVDPSTGERIGVARDPLAALGEVGIHSVVVLACVLWAVRSVALSDGRRRVAGLALAGVTVVALLGLGVVDRRIDPWRTVTGPRQCLTGQVVVCGPAEAVPLLRDAHTSVQSAIERLGTSGLDWQRRYDFVPTPIGVPAGSGLLALDPEGMDGGRLSTDDIVMTLMMPRVCAAYFAATPPMDLMQSQHVVREWVTASLRKAGRAPAAPHEVAVAYQRLRSCVPADPRAVREQL